MIAFPLVITICFFFFSIYFYLYSVSVVTAYFISILRYFPENLLCAGGCKLLTYLDHF